MSTKTVIIYQKTGGLVCSDGTVMEMARQIIKMERSTINVSTGLIIDAVRVMLATGEIDVDDVEFQFDGMVLKHGQDGRFVDWPTGFNDTIEGLLMQIL
jgi:hypothetical protein